MFITNKIVFQGFTVAYVNRLFDEHVLFRSCELLWILKIKFKWYVCFCLVEAVNDIVNIKKNPKYEIF